MQENLQNQNIPTIQPQPIDSQDENKKKQWIKISLFVFLGIVLLVGVFYAGIKFSSTREQNNKLPQSITQTPPEGTPTEKTETPTVSQAVGIVTNKIFYSKDNNIFSYDAKTKETVKWTNYAKNKSSSPAYDETGKQIPNIEIRDITVIDENTIGFGKCGVVTGDFGCGLYTLELRTKAISEKKKLDKEDLLLNAGWLNESKFAYLIHTKKNDGRWQFYLVQDGVNKKLIDLSTESYGRGGFIEDSEKIEFSPNGDRFFFISTAPPQSDNFIAFAVHGYDSFSGQEIFTIQNATMPVWLNNQKVIFRKYYSKDNNQNGVYIYDLTTREEKRIEEISADSYHPSVTPEGKIVFWSNGDKNLWIYNLESRERKLLINKAISGFWVTPTKVVYEEIEPCNGREGCGDMADYEVKSVNIFDLENNTKIDFISDLKSTYGVTSQYK